MRNNSFTSAICTAALCFLPVAVIAQNPPSKPKTTVEEIREVSLGMVGVMDRIVSALEKSKDKESAELAAQEITAATEKLNELVASGKKLKQKVTESDKLELAKTDEKQFSMQNIKARSEKAFEALSEKPELLIILQPALTAFNLATKAMYMDAAAASPVPTRAKD